MHYKYSASVVLRSHGQREDQGPTRKALLLVSPTRGLDCGGLPQDGGSPRDLTAFGSAIAHTSSEAALAGPASPAQREAAPEASRASSAHGGRVAGHRCKQSKDSGPENCRARNQVGGSPETSERLDRTNHWKLALPDPLTLSLIEGPLRT